MTGWAWSFMVPQGVADDPLMRATVDQMNRVHASLAATEQRVLLPGDPEVSEEPLVYVEGWRTGDDGEPVGDLVPPAAAEEAGLDGEPAGILVRWLWREASGPGMS